MVSYSGLTREINGTIKRLKEKARKKGIYENFGQKELRKLKDKYDYLSLNYGDKRQRQAANQIDKFEVWLIRYNG